MKRLLLLCSTALLARAEDPRLLTEMNAIAQRQLRSRSELIAAVTDVAGAEKRKAEVRGKVLALFGGLPEYRGPLNAKVTKTIQRDGYIIETCCSKACLVTSSRPIFIDRPARAGIRQC